MNRDYGLAGAQRLAWLYQSALGVKSYDLWSCLAESYATERAILLAGAHPGDSVLEVGVGTGRLLIRLAQITGLRRLVGIDLSQKMVRLARKRLSRIQDRPAFVIHGNALYLPLASKTFDALLSCYMLDLLAEADIRDTLEEFRRVLKPGGRLVLVNMSQQAPVFNAVWMWVYSHFPNLVGRCRPMDIGKLLVSGGWRVEHRELISQCSFRSELFLARPWE